MTAKEKVLQRHPKCEVLIYFDVWYAMTTEEKTIGLGKSKREAWEDAARRMDEGK